MNNDMIPVGTTVHINPEDIKWEWNGGDLISRSALKKSIKSYADDQYAENEYLGEYAIMDIIDNAPAVEVDEMTQDLINKVNVNIGLAKPIKDERPQGEWEDIGYGLHRCNKCGLEVKIPTNYCSFCGDHKQKDGAGNA